MPDIEKRSGRVAVCPDCHHAFPVPADLKVGQLTVCPACEATLQVAWNTPLRLDLVDDEEGLSVDGRPVPSNRSGQLWHRKEKRTGNGSGERSQSWESGDCPECESTIRFRQRPQVGQRVSCPKCAEVWLVVSVSPLRFVTDDDEATPSDDVRSPERHKQRRVRQRSSNPFKQG